MHVLGYNVMRYATNAYRDHCLMRTFHIYACRVILNHHWRDLYMYLVYLVTYFKQCFSSYPLGFQWHDRTKPTWQYFLDQCYLLSLCSVLSINTTFEISKHLLKTPSGVSTHPKSLWRLSFNNIPILNYFELEKWDNKCV